MAPIEFVVGVLIGGSALAVGAHVGAYRDRYGSSDLGHAVVTALLGALVWALLAWIPLIGTLLALVGWLAVVKRRYPVGWLRAAVVGAVAWAVAVVALAALELVGVGGLSAVGVPGT
ncbi:hypothetical protein [Haloparvum sedimenti]|uniref:hypothetical protein n=1 Tax=Haloparvum sedimenti TaxID=1678448 RepID=UPI00071E9243|nr:hypothetical protein [Haloparvum sedimenti]